MLSWSDNKVEIFSFFFQEIFLHGIDKMGKPVLGVSLKIHYLTTYNTIYGTHGLPP